jgi:hypothetical protein
MLDKMALIMAVKRTICRFLACIVFLLTYAPASGQPIDISDVEIDRFLTFSFQYDYTKVKDETSLRDLIGALDYQLAVIDYRQRREFITPGTNSPINRRFKNRLEERYRELLRDGFLFQKLGEWREKTDNRVNRAFIDLLMARREELLVEPGEIREMRQLAERIAGRLYKFHFRVGDKIYSAVQAAEIIEGGVDAELARILYERQNDSAALLAEDAARLYFMYNRLGERFGHRSSLDHTLSRLSFRKPEWFAIAGELKEATEAEIQKCLAVLREESGRGDLTLYEAELLLREGAVLPDEYFPRDQCDSAVNNLLTGLGLESLADRLHIRILDSDSVPTLAIKLYPPYDNILIKDNRGGFGCYRRLASEVGRSLPWVFADSSLPYVLRDYPPGTEEMLTSLFEDLALNTTFLSDNFSVPVEELIRFERYSRWLTVYRIRQVLLYFLFDYYLAEGKSSDPTTLYWSLEKSLLRNGDSSYHWIETVLTGSLERYPVWLAHVFSRLKIEEVLFLKFGEDWAADPRSGQFLIDNFCLPGRSQTLEKFISEHAPNRLSVLDIKRQLKPE